MLSDADRAYVDGEFVSLESLCEATGRDVTAVRAAIAARRLPAPPYPTVEYVPANYFDLPDAEQFWRTFDGPDAGAELMAYLEGAYFVCLRDATPANIRRKGELVTRIRALLDEPAPGSVLRDAVDELDALERPFSPDFDRQRFGRPVTRDELVTGAHERFPRLWE